jgi:hypothetical protein
MEPEGSLPPSQVLSFWMIRNMMSFYGEELLAPRPTLRLQVYPFLAVRDGLLNIFAATLHIGGRSSIRNLRTRHTVVTGTHLSWFLCAYPSEIIERVREQADDKELKRL